MICPHCNQDGRGFVLQTLDWSGSTYRRRGCDACDGVFISLEQPVPSVDGLSFSAAHSRKRKLNKSGAERAQARTDLKGDASELASIWGQVVRAIPSASVGEEDSPAVVG